MDWRDRLGTVVLICSSTFTLLLVSVMSPVLSTVAAHFGVGTGAALQAQSIITMSGVGMMFGGFIAGWLGDRIGARRTMLAMMALYGIAGSAGLYLPDIVSLLASRVVLGASASGLAASTYLIIAARFDGAARARMLGYQIAFLAVAGTISLLLAGKIAAIGGWRAPFLIYLSVFPMLGLALLARLPEGKAEASAAVPADLGVTPPKLWPLLVMIVPLYMGFHMFILHLSLSLAADGITDPATQSAIMAAMMAMTFVGGLLYGRLSPALGDRWTFVAILVLLAASNILYGATTGVAAAVAACAIAGIAGAALPPYLVGQVIARAPLAMRGRALGLMYMAMYLGDFLNPPIVTPLRVAIGNHEAFTLAGVLLAVGALVQALRGRSGTPTPVPRPAD